MATQLTLKEVLERAILKEIDAQALYTGLSQTMSDRPAKDAFQELTRQEKGHQVLLEKYLGGELKEGALGHKHAVDYKLAEKLDQPEISPGMKLRDVFMLAATREKLSHEFYAGLAEIHPAGEIKRLLEDLAIQELGHKQRMELLLTEVAFPQTDGG